MTLPNHKAEMIRNGMTREEYTRRFGMCDAAFKAFSLRDGHKALEPIRKGPRS
ncbi:MAG: hypothetical protein ACOVN5_13115 [Aquidulcibacter sp.]|jgi:hypothetical protein